MSARPPRKSHPSLTREKRVFDPKLAAAIGLNEAIVLQQLYYWLEKSTHVIDERRWIYNTVAAWHEQFPFWSEHTIDRALKQLEVLGVVTSGFHAPDRRDRTKWYTIDFDRLAEMDSSANWQPPCDQNGEMEVTSMATSFIEQEINLQETTTGESTGADAPPHPEKKTLGRKLPTPEEVHQVFDYFKATIQPSARLIPVAQIKARLKTFSVDELKVGMDKFAADAWWMDANGTRGGGWFFHSDARSEQFLNLQPRKEERNHAGTNGASGRVPKAGEPGAGINAHMVDPDRADLIEDWDAVGSALAERAREGLAARRAQSQ